MVHSPRVTMLTSAPDEAGMFVVYAARLHQRQEQRLCPLFDTHAGWRTPPKAGAMH